MRRHPLISLRAAPLVELAAPMLEFDRVSCALARSFLGRNRCGPRRWQTSADEETAHALNRFVERSVKPFAKHAWRWPTSGSPVIQAGWIAPRRQIGNRSFRQNPGISLRCEHPACARERRESFRQASDKPA
ncbi:blr3565 [Bradyrhizobium diazoefficiens USDA 110]|uniref:Blr3565 protein n=1 Tax=Bradyrhizobium diazoefficiens (strain JCM 10833 / BCRC 13528 / IAM 13628 / NBRC 14792 / USDA 110) TaxID=224911 RepID=Q89PB7_BRADU|nr:hypothetical protein CO678_17625 [Bradyrhizobium diazoefficiens]QBP22342.1 hypothetical protein Bdiaspc4_18415 [Bradyrhizobium diazoefficiens]BAC48830.1 blr3565 [Bradyrhizobium diazoefficiens USDA 110]